MGSLQKIAHTNRARYTLLNDRRRALFELHTLTEAIRGQPAWDAATLRYPGLDGLVGDQLARTSGELCGRACQASLPVLERDIGHLYRSLSELARVWTALEDGRDIEPLVAAY